MKQITFAIAIFILIPLVNLGAQSSYELLFLEKDYEAILELSKSDSTIQGMYWKTQSLKSRGDLESAGHKIIKANELYPDSELLELLYIDIQFQLGKYNLVTNRLENYLHYPDKFLMYIDILEFKENYHQAIELLNEAIVQDSLNLVLLKRLANNYIQTDRTLSAIQTYEKIIEINPDDLLSISRLANLYVKVLRYEEAIDLCNYGIRTDSSQMKFYRTKGIIYNKMSAYKESGECFHVLYENGDSSLFVLKNLGITKFYTREYESSIHLLLKAFQYDESDFEICYVLGRNFYNTDQAEYGLKFFNLADSLIQPDLEMLANIQIEKMQLHQLLQEHEKAIECSLKAYEYSLNPEYLFYSASLYQHKIEDKKKALHYFNEFLNALPEEKEHKSKDDKQEDLRAISMKELAERNIEKLREELFFEGNHEDIN